MSRFLPSNPNFLLNYLEGLPSDDSDSDFDGYIDEIVHVNDDQSGDDLNFPVQGLTLYFIINNYI